MRYQGSIVADSNQYDVLVIGGGPAGSTLGSLLKKYNSVLSVLIVEKEKFRELNALMRKHLQEAGKVPWQKEFDR